MIYVKKNTSYSTYIVINLLLLLISCSNPKNRNEESYEIDLNMLTEKAVEVETMFVTSDDFQKELIANGKVVSGKRAELRFAIPGVIRDIYIQEGQSVKSGQLLAQIDDSDIVLALQQSKLDNQRARLDYEDQLLRLGYKLKDTASLKPDIKTTAKIRSGLSLSEINLKKAEQQLAHTSLIAPFSGKIANLSARAFNNTSSFDYICTIVNNDELAVEFKVLEQELPFIKNSTSVTVSPFSIPDKKYIGRIVSINPIVDNTGMISVRALVNQGRELLDGMGVQVRILQQVHNQIVVPKEAVLDRQNRKVIFTIKQDSFAYWNYVEIAEENSTTYAIKSGLRNGDEIIVKGNFNLAHDRKVTRSN